jgi:hypothetical protein
MNTHTDRLIDEALALVRGALGRNQIEKVTGSIETNSVTSEHASAVAVSLMEIVTSGSAPSLISDNRPDPDVLLPERPKGDQNDTLIVQTVVQTVAIAERDNSWLDRERANMRSRVAAFRETQQRFQREREEYGCELNGYRC